MASKKTAAKVAKKVASTRTTRTARVTATTTRTARVTATTTRTARVTGTTRTPEATPPRRLAGGNPQIAKADGDAPVQAFIAAMPGWQRDVGRRLDALVARTVPHASKAVKWNSPFYGVAGRGWFLTFHCFTKYVKVAFFDGASLRPLPPGASTQENVRYLDVHEHDALDEALLSAWLQQAMDLPGWGKA